MKRYRGSHSKKLKWFSLLFLFFGFLSITIQDQFLDDLRYELNKLNGNRFTAPFTCNNVPEEVVYCCNQFGKIMTLHLDGLSLTSIPSSISIHSRYLYSIDISNAGLTSLNNGFCSLTNMLTLILLTNSLSSLLSCFGSLSLLSFFYITNNLLTSLPTSLSSLTLLTYFSLHNNQLTTFPSALTSMASLEQLDLQSNFSLQGNTEFFKDMRSLMQLGFEYTLVSGKKLESVKEFYCYDSCISDKSCSKNNSCPCSFFDFEFCTDFCSWCGTLDICLSSTEECPTCNSFNPTNCPAWCAGECGECSSIANATECDSPCAWCDTLDICLSSTEECPTCNSFNPTNCPAWCAGECGECSSIAKASECVSPCAWCGTLDTCLSSTEECPTCDSFNPTDCPDWCAGECGECSSIEEATDCVSPCAWCVSENSCLGATEECTEETNTPITLILICTIVPFFFLVLLVTAFGLIIRRIRRQQQKDEQTMTMTQDFTETLSMDSEDYNKLPEKKQKAHDNKVAERAQKDAQKTRQLLDAQIRDVQLRNLNQPPHDT